MQKTEKVKCANCGTSASPEWVCCDCHDDMLSIHSHEITRLYFGIKKLQEMSSEEKVKEYAERLMRGHAVYVRKVEAEQW